MCRLTWVMVDIDSITTLILEAYHRLLLKMTQQLLFADIIFVVNLQGNPLVVIRRYSWMPILMTQEVIDKVLYFGKKENVCEGVIIRNGRGYVEVNDVEYDDIEGVNAPDMQKNCKICTQQPKTTQVMNFDTHIYQSRRRRRSRE